jgi:hypothetical protein
MGAGATPDNTGLGSSGWGVIEIDDAGPDADADGLPDILDPYPTNAANAFDLREAGPDASFGTADDVLYTLRQTAFSGTGVSLRINEGTLGAGSYRFSVTPTLKDPAGNALDGNGDGSGAMPTNATSPWLCRLATRSSTADSVRRRRCLNSAKTRRVAGWRSVGRWVGSTRPTTATTATGCVAHRTGEG